MNEDRSKDLAARQGVSPNLVDAVRDVLAGKKPKPVDVEEMENAIELKKQKDELETTEEGLDPVNKKELKGKHKDRKDKDIDNDGDVDSSDKYLHRRRKAVAKAIGEAEEMCDCDCDCGKKVCESCGKPHKEADIKEGAPMVRGPDGQLRYKTGRMPLSLQRMARRRRPLAKRVMRRRVQVNSYDPTEVNEAPRHHAGLGAYYAHHAAVKAAGGKKTGPEYDKAHSAEMKKRGFKKAGYQGLGQHKWVKEETVDEGKFKDMVTKDQENKRLGKTKMVANPRNQKVRMVTPSRAKMAVKKGFVYAEHMEGLQEADAFKGQPVGVSVTMKKDGKKFKTSFPGTHSAVAGAKSHIAQMQKKGYKVHSKDLMYGKNEASEVNEARRGRPAKTPVTNQDTETRHNIVHQLRKSVSLRGQHGVEFKDGKTHKISAQHASQALNKYNSLRTTGEKANYQKQLHHSHDSFHSARKSDTPGAAPKKPGVSLGGGAAIRRAMGKN